MDMQMRNGPKPFNESIVDAMRSLNSSHPYLSDRQLMRGFAEMILMTEILAGHDEIIAAWVEYAPRVGIYDELGVVESVQAQKFILMIEKAA